MRAARQIQWVLPSVWCAITAVIIASGLQVPMSGGLSAAGFSYVFGVASHGETYRYGLIFYACTSAVLGAGFMFIPKITPWAISRAMAWSTLMLMAIGGVLMLIVPQVLVAITANANAGAWSVAQVWSAAWLEAGLRISIAGGLLGLATLVEAWMRRPREISAIQPPAVRKPA